MAQVGLFFGSDDGNTESVAYRIQKRLGEEIVDVFDIADVTQAEFGEYDKIIFGIPTWDFGQIQSDWEEFWSEIGDIDFEGKTIALFGLGDQFGYGDFFLDAMGMLHDVLVNLPSPPQMIGYWSAKGYEFDTSKALLSDQDLFVGLALDEDQQPEKTKLRLDQWCQQIHKQFELTSVLHVIED